MRRDITLCCVAVPVATTVICFHVLPRVIVMVLSPSLSYHWSVPHCVHLLSITLIISSFTSLCELLSWLVLLSLTLVTFRVRVLYTACVFTPHNHFWFCPNKAQIPRNHLAHVWCLIFVECT